MHACRMIWERLHAEGLALEGPPPPAADEDEPDGKDKKKKTSGGGIQLHGTIAKGSKMGSKARVERWMEGRGGVGSLLL